MKKYYFAGGGTGGHIYPGIAVAQKLKKIDPDAEITFFCSARPIDARILSDSGFEYIKHIALPMQPFSFNPAKLIRFLRAFIASRRIVAGIIDKDAAALISIGGFISVVPVLIARKLRIPVALINIDIVPGKANKLLSRFARAIFVQFEHTARYFNRSKVKVSGCPLRDGFAAEGRGDVLASLDLSEKKQTLLITGASSGAVNINNIIGFLLEKLNGFADRWQIVHICGINNVETVQAFYSNAKISYRLLGFCDDMPALLSAAELVVGRAGALSVAEYAASATPSISLPYPYHKDNHQRLNAEQLEIAGACRIVTDVCDTQKTAQALWPVLSELMKSPPQLNVMKLNCEKVYRCGAAERIAHTIYSWTAKGRS